ncbi:MAG: SIMPL domain-containing protein [Propionibacteriaceae bacterium]|jgi:hypothetical protein|nr:SIMPL domain-containing protein [Propionibacteriaceae bacterium]
MPATDIKVSGTARDVRTPDRAEVRLQVSKWGRDWDSIHHAVTVTVGGLTNAIKELESDHPHALFDHSIDQISQRRWTDGIGTAYSETVDLLVVFVDFQVMSRWVFNQSSEDVHVDQIRWQLSPSARNELSISLSVEAIRNARRKAETFAVAAGLTVVGIHTLTDTATDEDSQPATSSAPFDGRGSQTGADSVNITPVPIETKIVIEAHFLAEPDPASSSFPATRRLVPSFTPA